MNRSYLLILALTLTLALLTREAWLQPNNTLTWHVPYIGQGDAMLLTTPSGKQIVVDGGESLELLRFLGANMPWFDRTIELLILSHPDADHITALPELLKRYKVETILMTGLQHSSGHYDKFLHYIQEHQISLVSPEFGKRINMGDGVLLETLWPLEPQVGQKPHDPNHESVVVRVVYGNKKILLAGDIDKAAERQILASGQNIQADHLKVAHHGSDTSTLSEFIQAVNPNTAVISAGKDNRFGHPHTQVIERLEQEGVEVWVTAKDGDFIVEIDGEKN